MVKGTMQLSIGAALYALLLLLCVSCSDDDESPVSDEANSNTVTIGLKVSAKGGYSKEHEYESGTEYENYLDIANNDYRIYFFDADNDTYITKFEPDSVDVVPIDDDYTVYSVLGKVPEALLNYGTFKIVMLANWGTNNYPDDDDLTATTTIGDICSPTDKGWGTFSYKDSLNFVLDKSNLIPFYGVNTYGKEDDPIVFKANQATILDDPLTLLRAMAKVEVKFDTEDEDYEKGTVFTDVRVIHYNEQGYCAPNAVEKDDYDHNYTYEYDFADGVHLVNDGCNDYDTTVGTPIERSLKFQSNDDETMWYAYLPEYENTNTDYPDDYAYIEVKFKYRGGYEEGPYRIYFADYNEETGTTDNSVIDNRYDIQRNNLYRFTISLDKGIIRVHVNKWTEEWTNDFIYDVSMDDIVGSESEGNN